MTITWKGSPNYDSNRTDISVIVIHWFGMGTLSGADATFQKQNGTSAHYAVSDTTIHQYVKEEHVAYHAGNYTVNQKSIGIEHDANPDKPLSESSYQTSGKLIAEICARHNIPLDRQHIIKHSEVPRATQCSGTIDLDKLIKIAKGEDMSDDARISRDHYWNVLSKIGHLLNENISKEADVDVLPSLVEDLMGDVMKLEEELEDMESPIIPVDDKKFGEETGTTAEFSKEGVLEGYKKTYKPAK